MNIEKNPSLIITTTKECFSIAKEVVKLNKKVGIMIGAGLAIAFYLGYYIVEMKQHEQRIEALEREVNAVKSVQKDE